MAVASSPHVAVLGRIPGTRHFSDSTRHPDNEPLPGVLAVRPEASLLYLNAEHVEAEIMRLLEEAVAVQEVVCDLFEKRGHATVRSRQGTEEGYVHGLGHGVGLAVHEPPRLGGPPSNTQALEPGMVVTVEPGLYYPSRGLGVRIEDLVLVRSDGTLENLTPAPYDFEIEPGAS